MHRIGFSAAAILVALTISGKLVSPENATGSVAEMIVVHV